MMATGILAGEVRARGGAVDASVPDGAELYIDAPPELVLVDVGDRLGLEARYMSGEWRWISGSVTFAVVRPPG